jgi:hypothetical protein
MNLTFAWLTFAVQFGAILIVVTPAACLLQRIWGGRWAPTRHLWLGMSAASALLSLISTAALGFTLIR